MDWSYCWWWQLRTIWHIKFEKNGERRRYLHRIYSICFKCKFNCKKDWTYFKFWIKNRMILYKHLTSFFMFKPPIILCVRARERDRCIFITTYRSTCVHDPLELLHVVKASSHKPTNKLRQFVSWVLGERHLNWTRFLWESASCCSALRRLRERLGFCQVICKTSKMAFTGFPATCLAVNNSSGVECDLWNKTWSVVIYVLELEAAAFKKA